MRISELVIYPVKSLRGISLPAANVVKRGLEHDRRWMLVDSDGVFLTARQHHRLAMIDTELTDHGLRVSFQGNGLTVPFEAAGPERQVRVWNDECLAVEVDSRTNEWFSDFLGEPCTLVYMPEQSERPLKAPNHREGDLLAFSDGNPILFASQASIDDLNSRLPQPIPIRRFRPNVVLAGCEAFEEDTWDMIEISGIRFRKTMRSGRCLVTTLDIETGKTSDEPLRTLATYRKDGSHVWFGCYYAPESLGRIALGDEVTVSSAVAS